MRDDRAVSTTLGYTLTLAVATILVSGLLVAGGGFVQNQRESVTRAELEVVSQQFIEDVTDAGQIAAGTENATFNYRATLPTEAVGAGYTINVTEDGLAGTANGYEVRVSSDEIDVSVIARFTSPAPIDVPFTLKGGTFRIVFDANGSGTLVVTDA